MPARPSGRAAPRWVTFDCYGTLIDWEGGIAATLQRLWPAETTLELLRAYHRLEPQVQAGSGRPYREVMSEVLRALAAERGLRLDPSQEGALGESLPNWQPFPEVPAALAELGRRGWKLAVLSNTDPDLITASLRLIGVDFDVVVTAAEAGSYKPAPGHWRRFGELTGAGGDRQVHTGASLFHDMAPARELGLRAVWIHRAGDLTNDFPGHEAIPYTAQLPDLSGLPDTLDSIAPE